MSNAISLGGILAAFWAVSMLVLMLNVGSMLNNALQGNTQAVNEQAKNLANDVKEEAQYAPIEMIMPYILGILAILLTSICAIVGIPLVFRP